MKPILMLSVVLALLLGSCHATSAGRVGAGLHLMTIPGLPDADCGGPGSGHRPKCLNVTFNISALQVPNPSGGSPLCLAYFNYNTLTIAVGQSNGGATITWEVPSGMRFVGNGVIFVPPAGVPLSKILASQGPGTAKIKNRALLKREFGHLPDVEMDIGGTWTHCGGADPAMVITAD